MGILKLDCKNRQLATIIPTGATLFVVTGLLVRKWLRSRKMPPTFNMWGIPVFGSIIKFLQSPLELMEAGYKSKGECFKVDFLAKDMIFLVGKDGQEFFFTNDRYLDQAKMYSFTIPVFGPKVLYDTDQSTRMCQLRFIRERLTEECLSAYASTLEAEVVQYFNECWTGNEGVVDIRSSMIECLTRTAIRCLMGEELRRKMHRADDGNSVCDLLHKLENGMLPLSVFMPGLPCPRHWDRDAARREMSNFVLPIIKERRQKMAKGEVAEDDFLWKVLGSTYPDGRAIDDEEIVGFLVAAFFGGMHNSSITTSWSTLEIATRPDLVKELMKEQAEALGGITPDKKVTWQAYEKMIKLRSAVKEALRKHPPLMLLMRTVEVDIDFKQYTFPKGSVVAVSPNVAGMLPQDFPEPQEYKPFRFVNDTPDEFAYIPFGGGRRLCKGQEFGIQQVCCVISTMLRTFDIEAIDGVTKPTIGDGMVISPSQPCRIHYKRKFPKA